MAGEKVEGAGKSKILKNFTKNAEMLGFVLKYIGQTLKDLTRRMSRWDSQLRNITMTGGWMNGHCSSWQGKNMLRKLEIIQVKSDEE